MKIKTRKTTFVGTSESEGTMSLLEEERQKARLAAEAEAKRREEEKRCELARHPLLKMGYDRNVRDAYLHGIVIAAFADDRKIDKGERAIIDCAGASLGLGKEEVADVIAFVEKCEGKLALLKECCRQLIDVATAKLFACEFTKVWVSHPDAKIKDLADYWKDYFSLGVDAKLPGKMMELARRVLENISDAADEDLVALADWMGDDAVRYLVLSPLGDIAPRLKNHRQKIMRRQQRHLDSEREKLQEALKRIARYGADKASINQERLDYINEEVAGIDAEAIEFDVEVNRFLERIRKCVSGDEILASRVRSGIFCLFALSLLALDDVKECDFDVVVDCNLLLCSWSNSSLYDKCVEFVREYLCEVCGVIEI